MLCKAALRKVVLVGSPLYECPLPLPSTTSVLKAHDVQASQDMKLKLDSLVLYDIGSFSFSMRPSLYWLMTLRVGVRILRLLTQFAAHAAVLLS